MMVSNRRKPPPILDGYTQEERNRIVGAAIDSWIEKKWAMFGKWTAKGIAASAFGYLVYFLITNGWIHK